MRTIVIVVIALLATMSTTSSQTNSFYAEVDGSVTLVNATLGIHKFSSSAWGFGFGIARDLNPLVRFAIEGSYQKFPFSRSSVYEAFPMYAPSPSTTASGDIIVGEPSQAYRGHIGFRVAFRREGLKPFVSIGGGVMFYQSGFVGRANPATPQIPDRHFPLRGDDAVTVGYVFIGTGAEIPLSERISASIGIDVSTTLSVEAVTFPITSRLSLRL